MPDAASRERFLGLDLPAGLAPLANGQPAWAEREWALRGSGHSLDVVCRSGLWRGRGGRVRRGQALGAEGRRVYLILIRSASGRSEVPFRSASFGSGGQEKRRRRSHITVFGPVAHPGR